MGRPENSVSTILSRTLASIAKENATREKRERMAKRVETLAETLIHEFAIPYKSDDEEPPRKLESGEEGLIVTPEAKIELYKDQEIRYRAVALSDPQNPGGIKYFAINAQLFLGAEMTRNLPVFGYGVKEHHPKLGDMSLKELKKGANMIQMLTQALRSNQATPSAR